MDNEELERIMNFIIERQEYTAAQLARLTEAEAGHEERIARFERSYVAISQLLQKHDNQLVAVTEGLNNVTDQLAVVSVELAKMSTLVNRYIAARGDGGDGGA